MSALRSIDSTGFLNRFVDESLLRSGKPLSIKTLFLMCFAHDTSIVTVVPSETTSTHKSFSQFPSEIATYQRASSAVRCSGSDDAVVEYSISG